MSKLSKTASSPRHDDIRDKKRIENRSKNKRIFFVLCLISAPYHSHIYRIDINSSIQIRMILPFEFFNVPLVHNKVDGNSTKAELQALICIINGQMHLINLTKLNGQKHFVLYFGGVLMCCCVQLFSYQLYVHVFTLNRFRSKPKY